MFEIKRVGRLDGSEWDFIDLFVDLCSFVHGCVHLDIHGWVHSFIRSFVHGCVQSVVH